MASLLDNILSLFVGGIVLMLMIGLVINLRSSASARAVNTTVQTNLSTAGDIIQNDFRRMGYRLEKPPSDSAIRYASADSIVFRGDFNDDGVLENVRYYIGKTKPPGNINASTRLLYRNFNGAIVTMNLGISQLRFTYYDTSG